MSMQTIRIRGVDPLLFRDGRPFSEELGAQRADSLPVPYPGVVAGAVRTAVGNAVPGEWTPDKAAKARELAVHGPVVAIGHGRPVVAAPADAVLYRKDNDEKNPLQCMCLRPVAVPEGAGCNIPDGMLPLDVTHEEKPEPGHRFWAWNDLERWLGAAEGEDFDPVPDKFPNIGYPAVEERTHVKIGTNGIAEDGMLFTTASVCPMERRKTDDGPIERDWSYLVRVAHDQAVSGPLFLGGERRVAVADKADAKSWPTCPDDLKIALAESKRIRMALVTPAIFAGGWKPGWAGGSPPGLNGPKLTLKAACVPRREAVSGWDYAARGPKAVRWLVPAGSVFFFEAEGDTSALASDGWLAPVSDNDQDRLDGYGLAVWGIWDATGGNG
ncbi:MAG: type III-B CRISPR module-associated protein Cmr3 [Armatimonadetes bacterium]|nr:type III-B CRISPR module-associated protein Cmr3 [Armatimonadota bacterium]